jgi:hypothetical protein
VSLWQYLKWLWLRLWETDYVARVYRLDCEFPFLNARVNWMDEVIELE